MTQYNSLDDWLEAIGQRESSGNYSAVNSYNYLGKYQMGEGALMDAGYYKGKSSGLKQEWNGQFTGKNNIYSKQDFLANKQAQDEAMKDYVKKQWQILQANGATKYIGSNINGIDITPSGLLAMAHLKGGSYALQYLKSNGSNIKSDGYGTSPEEYLKKFGGYDVSELIDPNYYAPTIVKSKEDAVMQRINQGSDIISNVAAQVMPPSTVSTKDLNNIPPQPPLSNAEWRKRLYRFRHGLN